MYKIIFNQCENGDHFERYQFLDNMTLHSTNKDDLYKELSKIVENIEKDLDFCELWGSDTCIYNFVWFCDDVTGEKIQKVEF